MIAREKRFVNTNYGKYGNAEEFKYNVFFVHFRVKKI